MYIYGNNCSVNNECESGYSLYFPCIKSITRGENTCFDFYIVDNSTKQEVDLREIDDVTLNLFGVYNCNFGSYSYPKNIKSLQEENFSNTVLDIDFSNIIKQVKLYIDIVDEKHNLIESYLFDNNLNLDLDINIEGNIGYFLAGSSNYGVLNLNGEDTKTYMFLGWNIDENDESCNFENIYDFLIKNKKLTYNIEDDCVIRAVYQKRREYIVRIADDNYNSSIIVDYMGQKFNICDGESVIVLEGHDIKLSCIPNDTMLYEFIMWSDKYENPYRVINVSGDNLEILIKAYCELISESEESDSDSEYYLDSDSESEYDIIEYIDNIDANKLNIFETNYPAIVSYIPIDNYFIDNIYINNCEIDVLNNIPYIKIINEGFIRIDNVFYNIFNIGNYNLSINNTGGDCELFVDNFVITPSAVERNEFIFEYNGGSLIIKGNNSCIFGLKLNKEGIYNKGKCVFCLDSDDTLKLYTGDLFVDGGVVVNGNPYGLSKVKIAKVTNITPLIVK